MTLEEVVAALRDAARPDQQGEGFLVGEIMTATGLGVGAARDLIRDGLAAGTVRRATRTMECIDGRIRRVPSYVFLDAA